MVAMEHVGDRGGVARKVALCPLGNSATAPGNKNVLGEPGIGILDLDKGELNASLVEVVDQAGKLAI